MAWSRCRGIRSRPLQNCFLVALRGEGGDGAMTESTEFVVFLLFRYNQAETWKRYPTDAVLTMRAGQ